MSEECTAAVGDTDSVLPAWRGAYITFRSLNSALFAQVTRETGLPDSSFLVLSYLLNQPAHQAAMSQLARHLDFSTAGITKVTDRLTHAGLLERHPSPTDRRVVFAGLTAAGAEMAVRVDTALEDAVRDVFITRTGREDFDRLVEVMARLRSAPSATAC